MPVEAPALRPERERSLRFRDKETAPERLIAAPAQTRASVCPVVSAAPLFVASIQQERVQVGEGSEVLMAFLGRQNCALARSLKLLAASPRKNSSPLA